MNNTIETLKKEIRPLINKLTKRQLEQYTILEKMYMYDIEECYDDYNETLKEKKIDLIEYYNTYLEFHIQDENETIEVLTRKIEHLKIVLHN